MLPASNVGLAWLAWRHREPILDSGRFLVGAVGRLRSGGQGDVLAEARLRTRLLADPRVRDAPVRVRVDQGVARLSGTATPHVHAAVTAAAEATSGVRRVRDDIDVAGRRRWARRGRR